MEWRDVKKEEDKKIEQRAVQPAGNGFTPTPFDWRHYTNSEAARTNNKITNMPSPVEQKNLSEVHKAVQEIEQFLGRKININSAFRTEELNKMVGGVLKSSHRRGFAADLEIPPNEHAKVIHWLKKNMTDESRKERGLPVLNQVISYEDTGHLHIDVNPYGEAKLESRRYSKKVIVGTKIVGGKEINITELRDYF